MDTTTIEITIEQKERLNQMGFGSHKAALQELIESYEQSQGVDETRVREIANEQITERVIPEAQR